MIILYKYPNNAYEITETILVAEIYGSMTVVVALRYTIYIVFLKLKYRNIKNCTYYKSNMRK